MATHKPRITLTIPADMEPVWQEAQALLPGRTRAETVRTLVRAGLAAARAQQNAISDCPPQTR